MSFRLPNHGTLLRLIATGLLAGLVFVLARCGPTADVPAPAHAEDARPTALDTATRALVAAIPSAVPTPDTSRAAGGSPRLSEGAGNLLDVYPLAAGATWVYSVSVRYEEAGQEVQWAGPITETIAEVERSGTGPVTFRSETSPHPLLGPADRAQDYVAAGNRLYRLPAAPDNAAPALEDQAAVAGYEILEWPLKAGQQWGDPDMLARGDGWYVWRVEAQEPVTTPAGTFAGCYRVSYQTNPDRTVAWFCPGIGMVRRQYHHNGSLHDETWELARQGLAPR